MDSAVQTRYTDLEGSFKMTVSCKSHPVKIYPLKIYYFCKSLWRIFCNFTRKALSKEAAGPADRGLNLGGRPHPSVRSMVERPHSIRGGPGSIPGRCSSIFGIWREVLGRNVYIMSQYFFPAIIYRDIISHITRTYRYIMYFFRTFKKSTTPYEVHNMGLRYMK